MWALDLLNMMFCKYPVILIYSLLLWQMLLQYISREWKKCKQGRFINPPNTLPTCSPSAEICRWLSANIFGSIPSPLIRWQKCLFYLIMAVKPSLYFFSYLPFFHKDPFDLPLSSWPHEIWLVMKRPSEPHWKLSERAEFSTRGWQVSGGAAD